MKHYTNQGANTMIINLKPTSTVSTVTTIELASGDDYDTIKSGSSTPLRSGSIATTSAQVLKELRSNSQRSETQLKHGHRKSKSASQTDRSSSHNAKLPKITRSNGLANISRKSSIRAPSVRSMNSLSNGSSIFSVRPQTKRESINTLSRHISDIGMVGSIDSRIDSSSKTAEIEKKDTSALSYQISHFIIKLDIKHTLYYHIITNCLTNSLCQFNVKSYPLSKHHVKYLSILCLIIFISDYTINPMFLDSIVFNVIAKITFLIPIFSCILMCNYFVCKEACKSFVVWYKLFHACVAAVSRMIFVNYWMDHDFTDLKGSVKSQQWIYYLSAVLFVMVLVFGVFASIVVMDGYHYTSVKNQNPVNKVSYFGIIIGMIAFILQYIELYFNIYGYDVTKSLDITIFGQVKSYPWRDISMSSYSVVTIFFGAELYSLYYYPDSLNVVPLPAILKKVSLRDENNVLQDFFGVVDKNRGQTTRTQRSIELGLEFDADDFDRELEIDWEIDENEIHKDFFSSRSIVSQREYHLENILTVGMNIDVNNSEANKFDTIAQMEDKYVINIPIEFTLYYMILNKIFKIPHVQCVKKVIWFRSKLPGIMRFTIVCVALRFFLSFYSVLVELYNLHIVYEIIARVILDILMFVGFSSCLLNANYALLSYKCMTIAVIWKLYGIVTMYIAQYMVSKSLN